jgi:hypothetical protein
MWDNRKVKDGIMPWELECHRLATVVDETDGDRGSFVRLRSTDLAQVQSWVDPVHGMYRLYMEWCKFFTAIGSSLGADLLY